MTAPGPYEVVAEHEDGHDREELRRYPDAWEAVRMRAAVGGGWYVRDSIHIPVTGHPEVAAGLIAEYEAEHGEITQAEMDALSDPS